MNELYTVSYDHRPFAIKKYLLLNITRISHHHHCLRINYYVLGTLINVMYVFILT